MVCPFRVDVEFEYARAEDTKDGEAQYLEHAQRQVYANCVEAKCPFYEYGVIEGSCRRVGNNEED